LVNDHLSLAFYRVTRWQKLSMANNTLEDMLFMPTKTAVLVGREDVLTNHDKDNVAVCHVF